MPTLTSTDKLPRVIERMRNRIIESGGEVHFETRMERLIIDGDEVCGIVTADGREFTGFILFWQRGIRLAMFIICCTRTGWSWNPKVLP